MFLCDEINTIFFVGSRVIFVKYEVFLQQQKLWKENLQSVWFMPTMTFSMLFLKIPIKRWSKNTIVYINKQITYEQLRKSRNNYSKNVKFGADDKCFDEKQNN